jgi:FtsH-binding integral membrane protein
MFFKAKTKGDDSMQERRVVNDTGLSTFFAKVYSTMGGGLLITALISYLLGNVFQVQYGNFIASNRILYIVATFLPLILMFMISGRRGQESPAYARDNVWVDGRKLWVHISVGLDHLSCC